MALSAEQINRTIPRYCSGRIEEIEGYAQAVASPEKYVCHHRMEIQPDGTMLSTKWMIAHGIYYHLDPCMLIFLKESEHRSLHSISRASEDGFSKRFREHFGYGSEGDPTLHAKEKRFYKYYGFCSWEGQKPVSKQLGPHPERGNAVSTAKLKDFGKLFYEHTGLLPKENNRLYKRYAYRYNHNLPLNWGT